MEADRYMKGNENAKKCQRRAQVHTQGAIAHGDDVAAFPDGYSAHCSVHLVNCGEFVVEARPPAGVIRVAEDDRASAAEVSADGEAVGKMLDELYLIGGVARF